MVLVHKKLLCVEKENFVYIEFDKEKIDEVELKITKDRRNYVKSNVW